MKFLNRLQPLLLAMLLISAPVSIYAAGPGFNDNVNNWSNYDDDDYDNDDWCEEDDESNDIPLDGGLSFLAAAGAAYGVKRVRDSRKNKS